MSLTTATARRTSKVRRSSKKPETDERNALLADEGLKKNSEKNNETVTFDS
jgi:hypothetical protein